MWRQAASTFGIMPTKVASCLSNADINNTLILPWCSLFCAKVWHSNIFWWWFPYIFELLWKEISDILNYHLFLPAKFPPCSAGNRWKAPLDFQTCPSFFCFLQQQKMMNFIQLNSSKNGRQFLETTSPTVQRPLFVEKTVDMRVLVKSVLVTTSNKHHDKTPTLEKMEDALG